jgi:hypothetical protein
MQSLLLLLVVVVLLAGLARREAEPGAHGPVGREDPLAAALHRAVGAGVLTAEQVEAVLACERGAAAPAAAERSPARVPPVLEVLGYLGAILVMVGAVTLVARFWDDLQTWSRLVILGGTAAALTAAGLAVRDESEPVLWRLRGVLLFLGSGAIGGFTGLLGGDALDLDGAPVGGLAGSVVAGHAGLLWWRKDRPAQHAACLGGILAATIAGINWAGGNEAAVGFALWGIGGAWLAASFRRLFPPAPVGMVLGAVLALIGAGATRGQWDHFGVLFGLVTTALLVAGGIRTDAFMITAAGVIGTFVYLPATVNTFFGGTMGVPAVMAASGLALLGLLMRLLQRRGSGPGATSTGFGWPAHPRRA